MKRTKKWLSRALGFALVAAPLAAHATDSSDPTTIVTSVSTLEASIYPVVVGAVAFGIIIGIVRMVRKK